MIMVKVASTLTPKEWRVRRLDLAADLTGKKIASSGSCLMIFLLIFHTWSFKFVYGKNFCPDPNNSYEGTKKLLLTQFCPELRFK